jgi:hypothetical protein
MLRKAIYASVVAVVFGMAAAAPANAQPLPGLHDHHDHHYHVQYRMPEWRERDFISHRAAHEFADDMQRDGYVAFVEHHGRHYHVRYRMMGWRTYRTVESDRAAHGLERMLERRGYQARVVHH